MFPSKLACAHGRWISPSHQPSIGVLQASNGRFLVQSIEIAQPIKTRLNWASISILKPISAQNTKYPNFSIWKTGDYCKKLKLAVK